MYPRWIEKRVREELSDTRVVLLAGPRQAGKTTLAKKVAQERATFLTLDDPTVLSAAKDDPVGFVRGLDRATIDEIQRAPELILAIKRSVDDDPRPGRFLLTGSANLLTIPRVADSLAGRMAIVELLPLSV
jgi:predicted AAA+ superfamily ATPase